MSGVGGLGSADEDADEDADGNEHEDETRGRQRARARARGGARLPERERLRGGGRGRVPGEQINTSFTLRDRVRLQIEALQRCAHAADSLLRLLFFRFIDALVWGRSEAA